jgi:hypothetical protein
VLLLDNILAYVSLGTLSLVSAVCVVVHQLLVSPVVHV